SGNSAIEGGGLYAPASTQLTNSIIAENTAGVGPDVRSPFAQGVRSHGHNLIGITDGSSGWGSSDLTRAGASPLDPKLAPLGSNGGPTQTMALLPGSPAIDAGDSGAGIPTDQRGANRNGDVDIGAFEFGGVPDKQLQAITFGPLAAKTWGNADFAISGTAT